MTDHELVRQILRKYEGPEWRWVRQVATPFAYLWLQRGGRHLYETTGYLP